MARKTTSGCSSSAVAINPPKPGTDVDGFTQIGSSLCFGVTSVVTRRHLCRFSALRGGNADESVFVNPQKLKWSHYNDPGFFVLSGEYNAKSGSSIISLNLNLG